ncbi:hypothetical protein ACFL1P_01690 [Patescibacteria group bacterium]
MSEIPRQMSRRTFGKLFFGASAAAALEISGAAPVLDFLTGGTELEAQESSLEIFEFPSFQLTNTETTAFLERKNESIGDDTSYPLAFSVSAAGGELSGLFDLEEESDLHILFNGSGNEYTVPGTAEPVHIPGVRNMTQFIQSIQETSGVSSVNLVFETQELENGSISVSPHFTFEQDVHFIAASATGTDTAVYHAGAIVTLNPDQKTLHSIENIQLNEFDNQAVVLQVTPEIQESLTGWQVNGSILPAPEIDSYIMGVRDRNTGRLVTLALEDRALYFTDVQAYVQGNLRPIPATTQEPFARNDGTYTLVNPLDMADVTWPGDIEPDYTLSGDSIVSRQGNWNWYLVWRNQEAGEVAWVRQDIFRAETIQPIIREDAPATPEPRPVIRAKRVAEAPSRAHTERLAAEQNFLGPERSIFVRQEMENDPHVLEAINRVNITHEELMSMPRLQFPDGRDVPWGVVGVFSQNYDASPDGRILYTVATGYVAEVVQTELLYGYENYAAIVVFPRTNGITIFVDTILMIPEENDVVGVQISTFPENPANADLLMASSPTNPVSWEQTPSIFPPYVRGLTNTDRLAYYRGAVGDGMQMLFFFSGGQTFTPHWNSGMEQFMINGNPPRMNICNGVAALHPIIP